MTPAEIAQLAALVTACDGPGFGPALDLLVRGVAAFDMSCIFAFRRGGPPIVIHDGYSATIDRQALQSYLRGGYALDPFYSACVADARSRLQPGLWRMRDLAPDAFYDCEFAGSREVHPCISDQAGTLVEEIGFILPLSHDFAATYSLMRNRGGQAFDAAEFARLAALLPLVVAVLARHWQATFAPRIGIPSAPADDRTEPIFHEAFGAKLTESQRNVTKLILRGHSNLSIAANLGISLGTVKQHRYNIYKRLEISSQGELFRMFLHHVTSAAAVPEYRA